MAFAAQTRGAPCSVGHEQGHVSTSAGAKSCSTWSKTRLWRAKKRLGRPSTAAVDLQGSSITRPAERYFGNAAEEVPGFDHADRARQQCANGKIPCNRPAEP